MKVDRLESLVSALGRRPPIPALDGVRREAAVALILVGDPDRVLLIQRAEHPGDPWSGHWALPGGRREAHDTDLLDTAIRETMEETGIHLERVSCRAALSDIAPVSPVLPPIVVRPFVFLLDRADTATLSREVAQASWLALESLTAPGVFQERVLSVGGAERTVGGYQLGEGFLWGLTERILTPVLREWVNAPLDGEAQTNS